MGFTKLTGLFLAVLLGFCPSAFSEWALVETKSFNGGLNDSFDALNIDEDEASDLLNVYFPRSIDGSAASRPGYTRINSTALTGSPDCTGTTFFKLTDGTRYLVSLWDDDAIRKMDYGGSGPDGTWDDITGSLSFNVGTDDQADFAVAENSLIIEDGLSTTASYRWTGSGNAAALGGSSPNASMCEYHARHLFLAGNNTNPSRLYFSNLDDIATWTATDFIRVETDSSDGVIRGLKAGLDSLYIWKDSSIWRLSGTNRDDFRLERMIQGIGTLSNASIAIVNNPATNEQLFFFVTQYGDVAVYDGGITVRIISHKISNSVPNSLNFSRLDEVVATDYDFHYIISASRAGVSTHDRLYLFDVVHQAWTRFSGMPANALGTFENSTGRALLMFGDTSGRVNQWDITDTSTITDPGTTAIDAYIQTGWKAFAQLGNEKRLRASKIWVNQEGTGRNLDVEIRSDFADSGSSFTVSLAGSGSVWDTAVWDSSRYADLNVTIERIEPDLGSNVFLFRFSNGNRAADSFRLRKIQNFLETSGRV